MEKKYILAQWLNNELTEDQLAEFKANPDNEKYEQIKNYTAHLEVPLFNEEKVLEHVINHKKIIPKILPSYKKWLFKAAAVFVIGIGIVFMMQNFALQTQYAPNGKKTTFLLPDNSKVVLNAGSEIKYKKWNWDNNRNLELDGEAYFKVAKGEKFEVTTVLGKVAVLGTQFNVKVRKDRFDVTCFEGRVLVKYQEKELILLYDKNITNNYWKLKADGFISNFAYPIIHPLKNKIVEQLQKYNVECRPLICGSMSRQPFFYNLYGTKKYSFSDLIHDYGLYLPNNPDITENEIQYICNIVNEITGEI